ncbi:MAG: ROK family protein [Anaerolineaceae bacterium]|nr:MAG: ROK family protein [Anaerolineaceae bacterium]
MIIGALEAGGTKMVCAIGDENGNIIERTQFPTETPAITMPQLIAFYKDKGALALGIGCFGPINPDKNSKTYGYITSTPKLAWRNYNIVKAFHDALKVPIGFDTDVNGAALGETAWGALSGCEVGIYITIGTGVGVGVCINGKPLHGLMHPEGGHIFIKRLEGDDYKGNCPYHLDCFEGLAAGPAIEGRFGKKAYELQNVSEVWDIEAHYIAQAICNYIFCYSPGRIVLGGGVMHQEQLFPIVRAKVKEYLKGYINAKEILDNIDSYIVPPKLGDNAGIKGALKLGFMAIN